MFEWILSAMDLSAKLALGFVFWSIALSIVGVIVGGIVHIIDRRMR